MSDITCPNCGDDLSVLANAALPDATDLTLTLSVQPGQFVRLDTIAGTLSAWRDLQIAVGESMGAETEVFLASIAHVGNDLRFTTRIVNVMKSGEAAA